MRIVRVDLASTTDVNGNATIIVPLPFTGAWYDLKFSLQISQPSEWALSVSGTTVTYGRGRRVTLGPELIQDGETVTISVSGGPPNAAIIGSANGKAGHPDEILAGFTMSPNTIALDVSTQPPVVGTLKDTNPHTLPLPAGTVAVGYSPRTASGVITQVTITGVQTGIVYFNDTLSRLQAIPVPQLIDTADTSITCQANGANPASPVDILAWGVPVIQFSQLPPSAKPLPWQAATSSTTSRVAPGLNTDFTIVAGASGQTIYVHDVVVNTNSGTTWEVDLWDGPSANNVKIADLFQGILTAVGVGSPVEWDGHGRPLATGNALVGTLAGGDVGSTIFGTYGYSQK